MNFVTVMLAVHYEVCVREKALQKNSIVNSFWPVAFSIFCMATS
jgi:hypothetical protein